MRSAPKSHLASKARPRESEAEPAIANPMARWQATLRKSDPSERDRALSLPKINQCTSRSIPSSPVATLGALAHARPEHTQASPSAVCAFRGRKDFPRVTRRHRWQAALQGKEPSAWLPAGAKPTLGEPAARRSLTVDSRLTSAKYPLLRVIFFHALLVLFAADAERGLGACF